MRQADMTPPLGKPGGPCHLMDRIRREVNDPHLEERLISDVEQGQDLSNEAASKVYDLEVEPGVGVIRQVLIGPHAAYRMDFRSITVADVREALSSFVKEFSDAKSRRDLKYVEWSKALQRGERVEYLSPKKLFVVFVAPRPDQIKLVTTYRKGQPDPKPKPGVCDIRLGYRPPVGDLAGIRIKERPEGDEVKQQVLPSPQHSRSKPVKTPSFNTPPAGGDSRNGPSVVERARTQPSPGEDSPKTEDVSWSPFPKRRHDAAVKGPQYPGTNRQKSTHGLAKTYYERYYKRNRTTIRNRMKKWYGKNKSKANFKRDKERRQKHPEKFKRMPGGGYTSIADRSKDYREKNKHASEFGIDFYHEPTDQYGRLLGVDDMGIACLELEGVYYETTLEVLLQDIVPVDELDVDRLVSFLDNVLGYEEPLEVRLAEIIERDPIETDPGQKIDRATPRFKDRDQDPTPGGWPTDVSVFDNPGSAKVIPYNKDFVNNRAAARIADIVMNCSSGLKQKAQGLAPKLTRVDQKNTVWLYDVKGKSGTHRVRVKALPKGNITAVAKMDVLVSCSCPFWQWQGPEHWAKAGGYLFGRPRGTASEPVQMDPVGEHRACHHVLSVLARFEKTEINPKNRGVKKRADLLRLEASQRVAQRYLQAAISQRV